MRKIVSAALAAVGIIVFLSSAATYVGPGDSFVAPVKLDTALVTDVGVDPLVPPLDIPGLTGSPHDTANEKLSGDELLAPRGFDLLADFAHDSRASFHPHGTQVCASGCATSNHPTETLTAARFHQLLEQYMHEPLESSAALDALLYYGRQARDMLERDGAAPLDVPRAALLKRELARTHARVLVRVVDADNRIRAWLPATAVPLDRRHVFEMETSGVQPLVTSGTVKRVGLDYLWTRL